MQDNSSMMLSPGSQKNKKNKYLKFVVRLYGNQYTNWDMGQSNYNINDKDIVNGL